MDNDLYWLKLAVADAEGAEPEPAVRSPRPVPGARDWAALLSAERACCCPAPPAVVAVLAPRGPRREPTDLLLCRHHYRASCEALAAAGAVVFDADGEVAALPHWAPAA